MDFICRMPESKFHDGDILDDVHGNMESSF